MINTKKNIIKTIMPKAVLLPLTKEATNALVKGQYQHDLIPMMDFPFKVGRESRLDTNDNGLFVKLRLIRTPSKPNNDIYLINEGRDLQISKEHFQIERTSSEYILKDRGSSNGTTINDITYGGEKEVFEKVLNDGDIIKIGTNQSLFKYQFLILEDLEN
ncbi:FHA domain-containing protein [Poseidonibacter lekithochrous]|uniref:FHA domain-containing protein n=1 Tax=Poseidonibacter TaxID=2321187 RepID=UPI001C08EB4D|nr:MULTISPECIES: FHA domain-containing protein [Poseidonibacter]MBU3014962.1 FHA domain-containing protein [Poseidonibacter lekithochrous]MDO6828259.1 FHA domain-containing protein [Poseidonibacter sp. 1_MG-2023]